MFVALLCVGACTRPAPTTQPTPATTAARALPNEIRWFRSSAEYRALARQAYAVAGDRIPELARGLAPQSWAVILDADETVLDNSEYQRRRAVLDSAYTEASWAKWVNERAAPPVPGAAELTHKVHALGGRVAIVTNRADSLCAATRANLQSAGIETDIVLCQPGSESDKNPRFRRIQTGGSGRGGSGAECRCMVRGQHSRLSEHEPSCSQRCACSRRVRPAVFHSSKPDVWIVAAGSGAVMVPATSGF